MSSSDLESIIPKSNADSSDETDDEYEVVTDTSEEDVKPAKGKKHKKCKSSKHASPIRTKKTKLPSRGAAVGSDQLPPLQTENPAQHALEAPKPMLVKQAIDNQFDKAYQIDLSKETQQGIAYQHSQQVPQQPVEEKFEGPFYKHKYFPIIVVVIVAIACIAGAWWYFRHKFRTGYDPIKATLTGGSKDDDSDSSSDDDSDDEDDKEPKSLNELTGSAGVSTLPPSYEDSFDRNDDSDGEEVMKHLKSVPKQSKGSKSAPKKESKSTPKSAKESKATQRDSRGRFVKK